MQQASPAGQEAARHWFDIRVNAEGHFCLESIQPGLLACLRANMARRRQEAEQGREQARRQARDSSPQAARVQQLESQIADARGLLSRSQALRDRARSDARAALASGQDPSGAEAVLRQALADEPVYRDRLSVLEELLADAQKALQTAGDAEARAFVTRYWQEIAAEQAAAKAEVAEAIRHALERAVSSLDIPEPTPIRS